MKGPVETELKLDVPPEFHLPDLTTVPGLSLVSQPEKTLVAHYYDTEGSDLARWGATVRYRAGGGSGTWTVKLDTGKDASATSRYEIDIPGGPEEIPDRVLGLTMGLRRGRPLAVRAELTTTRRGHLLLGPGGAALAELDDDTVGFTTMDDPPRSGSFREVEVELLVHSSGSEQELESSRWSRSLNSLLARSGAKRNDGRPKVMRALSDVPPPLRAARHLAGRVTLADLVGATVEARLARLLAHEVGIRLDEDAGDVHKARVAVGRLRVELKTLAPVLDPGRAESVDAGLGPLARALAGADRAAALEARLRGRRSRVEVADRALIDQLGDLAGAESRAARERLLDHLEGPDHGAGIEALFGLMEDPPLLDPDAPAAGAVLPLVARRWAKLRRAVRKLPESPTDQELDGIRRRAKECRYAADMSSAVLGAPARGLAGRLADLQDCLGRVREAAVTEEWLRRVAASGGADRAMVAGELIGAQRRRAAAARRSWETKWAAVADKKVTKWLRSS